jgi:Rieske Fe-S protein
VSGSSATDSGRSAKRGQNVVKEISRVHRGGPLDEGERDGDMVTCPWHGSWFDLCSGEVLRGPAGESQQRFENRVREGKIEVRREHSIR